MNRLVSITLVTIIILSLITPGYITTFANNAPNYILIKDALGRTINITEKPLKIVSLAPSITEEIFYLGLQKYLIGVDNTSYSDPHFGIADYLKENKITPVGGYWWSTISVEKILSLKPDIVFADKGAHIKLLDFFNKYNITVIYLNAGASKSLQDIYEDLNILATIYGKEQLVTNFIKKVEKNIATYRVKFESFKYKKILVVVGIYNGIWVAGKSTYIDDMLSRLGLENVADVIGWKSVNIEKIIDWSPQLILITSMGITRDIVEKSGLYKTGAQIIFLDQNTTDALCRPGPLIIYLPSLLYKYLSSINITETQSETNTLTTTTSTQPENVGSITNNIGIIILITAVFFIIGVVAGYYISRAKKG